MMRHPFPERFDMLGMYIGHCSLQVYTYLLGTYTTIDRIEYIAVTMYGFAICKYYKAWRVFALMLAVYYYCIY